MMDTPLSQTKVAIAALLASAEQFSTALRRLPDHLLLEPMAGIHAELSPRDLTAQLIGWTSALEEAIEPLTAGPAPAEDARAFTGFANRRADAIRRYRADSKMALLMGLHAAVSDLGAVLEAIPEPSWEVELADNGGTVSLFSEVQAITKDFDGGADEIARWLEDQDKR